MPPAVTPEPGENPGGGAPSGSSPWVLLAAAGDEAVLPAGCRLSDEAHDGRQCFVIMAGSAAAESGGQLLRGLSAGDFVGSVDTVGRPGPPHGITVWTTTRSRVLVIDPARLVALIESDPSAAAAWRRVCGA